MTKKEGFLSTQEEREFYFGKDLDKTYYKLFKTIARIDSITPTQKLILTGIMSFNMGNGEFFMTNETICYEFGCNISTTKRTLKELRELDLITIYKRFDAKTQKYVHRVIKCNVDSILKRYQESMENYTDVPVENSTEVLLDNFIDILVEKA